MLAFRIARRELRGGLSGFRVFLACLALGVAAIAGVHGVSAAIEAGLARDAQAMHGGDLVVRSLYQPIAPADRAMLEGLGKVSSDVEMRAMARAGEKRRLVELRLVDDLWPLYGTAEVEPAMAVPEALAKRNGVWGALVETALLPQLGIKVGDRVAVGEAEFEVRGVITREPDRGTGLFSFGPRFMAATGSLPDTRLVQPGSLIRYEERIALAPGQGDVEAVAERLRAERRDAGWRVSTHRDTAPGLKRTIDRLTSFLTLVGLASLLVGGIGVANAVRSFLATRTATIATLKCLGAPAGLVFSIYLIQIMALGGLGIAIGLAVGAGVPYLLAGLVGAMLPVALVPVLDPLGLAVAAAFGLLVTLAFGLWPLARAREIPAARLFRDIVAQSNKLPRASALLSIGLAGAALAGLVIATSADRRFALWFVAGALGLLVLFLGVAALVGFLARRLPRPNITALRLALGNLARPGAPTASVVLSLGFGVTVLVAVALVEDNLGTQVRERLPAEAPSYFFIDIQKDQVAGFDDAVRGTPGATEIERLPHLRARISKINGRPPSEVRIAEDVQWAVQNERGLTYMGRMPPDTKLVAGEWWPENYAGPPLISFDAKVAAGFGIGVGDTLSFTVLGREIEARIANLRQIEWGGLQMQFAVVFAPGTLEAAPQTFIATVRASDAAEGPLVAAVTDRFPNVSAIRVKDALTAVSSVLDRIGLAIRAVASISLLAGALVLAGAVAAGQRRRVYEAVVLKVLGATRADVARAYLVEFLLLGGITALIGAAAGGIAAWAIVTRVLGLEWNLAGLPLGVTTAACIAVTLTFGFVAVWRALARKAAPILRHP